MRFFLLEKAYRPTTQLAYKRGAKAFYQRLQEWGADPVDASELDLLFTRYIHEKFLEKAGKGRQAVSAALYGVCMCLPEVKRLMPSSKQSLLGWARHKPSVAHPPITWELTLCVAAVVAKVLRAPRAAVAILVAFDCYLRIGEVAALDAGCVASGKGKSSLPRLYRKTALQLKTTKTGENQFVHVRRECVETLLLQVRARAVSRSSDMFPSAAKLRSLFNRALQLLGIDHLGFVFHSLRHGGATTDQLLGVSLDEVLMRGRWAAARSARHYIQSGKAQLINLMIPPGLSALGVRISKNVEGYFQL